jgi:hypothetical protein
MNAPLKPETLSDYLEGWRRKIWDQGFMAHLRGTNYFKKNDNFMNFEGGKQAVRRVLFRYVSISLKIFDFITCKNCQLCNIHVSFGYI